MGPALIGREPELDVMRRAMATAVGGHGQVVVIEGEAGIGKSRIVREVVATAADLGADVHEGFCDDSTSAAPFSPLVQALQLHGRATDPDRRAVAELLAGDELTGSRVVTSGKHFRVVELVGALVEKLAETRPLLLVLEDVHWADDPTLSALRSIAQRIRLLPVLIVVTGRPGYEREELHRTVDALLRAGAIRLVVGPLAPEHVTALAAEVLGAAPSASLVEQLAGASGNPLFVTEFVNAIGNDAGAQGVPVEFRITVLRRVGQLSDETNEALRVAAVLGSTFAAAELAIVLGLTSVELTTRLQQAMQSGIIGERGDRLVFRHDLVRDAIYEHIPLALRRQIHREVGEALARAGVDPLVVAHHLALAAESYDAEAASWLRRAAHEVRLRAPSAAVALLERARDLLPPSSPDRDALLADMVMPLAWAGRLTDAEQLSLELLSREPSPEVAGALRCGLVYALTWQGRAQDALAYTAVPEDERLLDEDAALLWAEAALALVFSGAPNFAAAGELAEKAEAQSRAAGSDLALCQALSVKSWVLGFRGHRNAAIEVCREAIEIADRSKNGEGHLAHPRFFPGISLINLDRVDEAQVVLERGRQISDELGLVWALPLYHSHLGGTRFIAGDWDAAVAELTTCLSIAEEYPVNIGVHMAAHAWLSVIYTRRDDLDAAQELVRHGLASTSGKLVGFGLFTWARAVLAEAQGNLAGALEILEPAHAAFLNAGASGADPWTTATLVRYQLKAGNREGAAAIASAREQADEPDGTPSIDALRLLCRGLADNDPETLRASVDLYRTSRRRVDVADACVDLGLCLIDRDRADDAVPYFEEALDVYEDIGAARDIARLRAELRTRGIVRGARGRRARATTGWESLTETELKVVGLVAQRMSNPEVAERLFVSRHTVESHLKNIYRKLGIGSRVELATTALARSTPA